jgi:plasmid stabilization system protein ParE
MVYKVNWTPKAVQTYLSNMHYLQQEWTEREMTKFAELVEKKINLLRKHPNLGASRNNKLPNIRQVMVHKRVSLIYRVKPVKKEPELLLFWNTWQNPAKLKFW